MTTQTTEQLRKVTMRPYVDQSVAFTLETFDTGKVDRMGKYVIAYRFSQGDKVLFEGDDFHCSPMYTIDSGESLRSLLGFLTLRPGDTDEEYFKNYTQEQLDFANEHAEILSLYAHEDNPDEFDESN